MMAGSTHPGGPGGGTRRVSPADYTGNLPPARPPYGAERARYDDWEPERKSKWPIVAAVAAIAVLAIVVGVYAATRGGAARRARPRRRPSPTPRRSRSPDVRGAGAADADPHPDAAEHAAAADVRADDRAADHQQADHGAADHERADDRAADHRRWRRRRRW